MAVIARWPPFFGVRAALVQAGEISGAASAPANLQSLRKPMLRSARGATRPAVAKVNVPSSPELMVLDGQPASLQVGNLVPHLTPTSQSTLISGPPVINPIDYRETGVILLVTPRVIRTQQQADLLTAGLREALPDAAAVPGLLQVQPNANAADADIHLRRQTPP